MKMQLAMIPVLREWRENGGGKKKAGNVDLTAVGMISSAKSL